MTQADQTCRVVVLISGSGSNLQAMIEHFRDSDTIEIAAVISNRAGVQGLARAEAAGIPTRTIDHHRFSGREAFDQALLQEIDAFQPSLVVLAGFMRILTPAFVRHYEGRLFNIHPSLLPRYPGLKTHQRAIDNGDPDHGATVHFVTAALDGGPAILQARVPVQPDDTPDSLAARVLPREHQIYPLAVEWFCQGRLAWYDQQPWLDGQKLDAPVSLDDH